MTIAPHTVPPSTFGTDPLVVYFGNGIAVSFHWDWAMTEDSAIGVLVDNEVLDEWSLQGNSVVFESPPADGAVVVLFRRTKIWMPEDYVAFGRFAANKTELSVDRIIMIAQEYLGNGGGTSPPLGVIGAAHLFFNRNEFDIDLISERGADTIIPMWIPDDFVPPVQPPDPDIKWDGPEVFANSFTLPGDPNGVECKIEFRMDLTGGVDTDASAGYPNNNVTNYVSWLAAAAVDDDYWMRVSEISSNTQIHVNDGSAPRSLGEVFQIRGGSGNVNIGPNVNIDTFGDQPPIVNTARVLIEICKDNGLGIPSLNWVERVVSLEARFSDEVPVDPDPDPDPPPGFPDPDIDITGATSWEAWFGTPFGVNTEHVIKVIPDNGVSLWFTVDPNETRPIRIRFYTTETLFDHSIRTFTWNRVVGDFTTPPVYVELDNGAFVVAGINQPGIYDLDLIPGSTYIFNMRRDDVGSPNWIRVSSQYQDQT